MNVLYGVEEWEQHNSDCDGAQMRAFSVSKTTLASLLKFIAVGLPFSHCCLRPLLEAKQKGQEVRLLSYIQLYRTNSKVPHLSPSLALLGKQLSMPITVGRKREYRSTVCNYFDGAITLYL